MMLLVEYLDFHIDNYQGGSGKTFEFTTLVEVDPSTRADEVWETIHKKIRYLAETHRPFGLAHVKPPVILKVTLQ